MGIKAGKSGRQRDSQIDTSRKRQTDKRKTQTETYRQLYNAEHSAKR